jgi:hypothetical protein
MADLAIVATDVFKSASAGQETGTAGAAIAAGQALYKDPTTGNMLLAQSDVDDNQANCTGIALHAAAVGQPISYCNSGQLTVSAVLSTGQLYVLSGTPGGIAPVADLATGWRTVILGYAISTTVLKLLLLNTKVAVP